VAAGEGLPEQEERTTAAAPAAPAYEAIGLVELQSIAWGVDVADVMVKAAPVDFVDTFMVTPGKYVVLVHGDPSSVESSVAAGRGAASEQVLDWLLIPFVHPQVFPAILNRSTCERVQALGLIETASVAAGVLAADRAAKAAQVDLLQLVLARGIGGKSLLTLTGELFAVQAAVEAGKLEAEGAGKLVAMRVIPNPHPDLAGRVLRAVRGEDRGDRGARP
jgi:microcompartment protein CcmL/EutN